MKCDNAMKLYMNRDNGESLPLWLSIHIRICKECRDEINLLNNMLINLTQTSPYYLPYEITSRISKSLSCEKTFIERKISTLEWLSTGIIIFFSIFLINFSDTFVWLKNEFGPNYLVPFSIVIGTIFTSYALIVIACNYEYIKKYIFLLYRGLNKVSKM